MNVEDRMLVKNLAKTAEIVNTINGGMSQAKLHMKKESDEWLLRFKVPGVGPDNLKIEVRNSQLFIFQILGADNSSGIELPYLITSLVISPKIDFEGIIAEYDGEEICVHMPLDEMSDGHEREIEIIRK
jgi:hypothetical protein